MEAGQTSDPISAFDRTATILTGSTRSADSGRYDEPGAVYAQPRTTVSKLSRKGGERRCAATHARRWLAATDPAANSVGGHRTHRARRIACHRSAATRRPLKHNLVSDNSDSSLRIHLLYRYLWRHGGIPPTSFATRARPDGATQTAAYRLLTAVCGHAIRINGTGS